MCGNDLDFLHVVGVEKHDIPTHGFRDSGTRRRDMIWRGLRSVLFSAHGVCDVVVDAVGREGADGVGIRGSDDLVEHLHRRHVVDKDEIFHDDEEAFAIQSDGADSGGKGELAHGGLALGVDDAQMPR